MAGITWSNPSEEPITVDDIAAHVRADSGEPTSEFAGFIAAARRWAEEYTGQRFIQRGAVCYFDGWPRGCADVILPAAPLASVSAVEYIADATNAYVEWSSSRYQVDAINVPPRLRPVWGQSYPTLQPGTYNAVKITLTAGIATAAENVPDDIKHALLLLCGHFYQNREAVLTGSVSKEIEFSVTALLGSYRVWRFGQ